MSKQGPKSALSPAELKKQDLEVDKSDFMRSNHSLSKNRFASVYLKHMVTEIFLLLACNNLVSEAKMKQTGKLPEDHKSLALVP